jgi:hypothetical protein
MSCENNSTSSLHSDHSLDESENPDSLCEDDSDAQSQNSGLDSVEDDTSCNLDDESQDCSGQLVRGFSFKCASLTIARIMMFMMPGIISPAQMLVKVHIYIEIQ